MLIARYSSSAHELMLQFLSVFQRSLLGAAELVDVLLHRPAGKASRDPEGPWEGSSAERQGEAVRGGVQVCAPSREPAPRIRYHGEAGSLVGADDSQQLLPGSAPSTPHTRANLIIRHTSAHSWVRDGEPP